MNPLIIKKRVAAIDSTTASIVGIGAWCALHAGDAATIVSAICDRIAAPPSSVMSAAEERTSAAKASEQQNNNAVTATVATEEEVVADSSQAPAVSGKETNTAKSFSLHTPCDIHKAACLYVLHEMVVSCGIGAVSEAVRRQALSVSIAARLPSAIRHAITIGEAAIVAGLKDAADEAIDACSTSPTPTHSTMFSLISASNARRESAAFAGHSKAASSAAEGKSSLYFVDDFTDFLSAVLKVTSWWNTPPLNVLFSKDKLKEMRAPVLAFNRKYGILGGAAAQQQQVAIAGDVASQPSTAFSAVGGPSPPTTADVSDNATPPPASFPSSGVSTNSTSSALPRQLSAVVRLLGNYETAKERFDKLSASLLLGGGAGITTPLTPQQREELDGVREEASRRLIFAIKALDGRGAADGFVPPPPPLGAEGADRGLLSKLYEDFAELQNSAVLAPPAPIDEKDDLLGSFF